MRRTRIVWTGGRKGTEGDRKDAWFRIGRAA